MEKVMKLGIAAICLVALMSFVSCGGAGVKKDSGEKLGDEMVKDSNFPDNSLGDYSVYNALSQTIKEEIGGKWKLLQNMPAKGHFEVKDGVCKIVIESPGNDNWQVQLTQMPVVLKFGKKYKMAFDVKADKPRKFQFKVGKIGGDWLAYSGQKAFDATVDWQTIAFVFKSLGTDDVARVEFECSNDPNALYFKNVSLKQVLE